MTSTSQATDFLATLADATKQAEQAEASYRADFAKRVEELAQARAFAHRRANLLRAVAGAVAQATDAPMAVAYGLATLHSRLGWGQESASREEIIAAFAPVCAALHGPEEGTEAKEPADPAEALAAFEAWYIAARGAPFWVLFEQWMPETPVVDF